MLAIYLCYFYELHELTQIRAGVASGFSHICSLHSRTEKKNSSTSYYFRDSIPYFSNCSLPTLLLGNKPLNKKTQLILYLSVPMGYFIYFTGTSILFNLDIPLIGDKLSIYQEATEKVLVL